MTKQNLFKQFIHNKSVAIVGRSDYLNDLEQGEYIDSHDVVIRVHHNLPYPAKPMMFGFENSYSFVPTSHHSRIGQRTDAFAPSDLCFWDAGKIGDIISKLKDRGCKWIIQHRPYHLPESEELLNLNIRLSVVDYTSEKYLPVFETPGSSFQELMRELDYSFPMPGTSLINDIVLLLPSRLYVTGFGCYMGKQRDQRWLKAMIEIFRQHKPLYDLRYLRNLERLGQIQTDEVMLRYFREL